jgi:NAD(P)H-dependent FMN reductase
MPQPNIVAFSGSTREASLNKKLVRLAASAARDAGASVTEIDLRDFPMPFYDGDLQDREGFPENSRRFKEVLVNHDAMLIASPEYNRSISGILKNAIDWASRSAPGEPSLAAFNGKTAGIMAASPGLIGGYCGLFHLRALLGSIGVLVLSEQVTVAKAGEAFDEEGRLKDPKTQASVERVARRLVKVAAALKES